MTLIPKGTVLLVCDGNSFNFTETTGIYDVSTNPGGYTTPNPDSGDCTATLTISNESSDVDYDPIDITPSNGNTITNIPYSDIELGEVPLTEIADGIWKFVFKVTDDDDNIYTAEIKILVIKSINCSLIELAKKYSDDSCGCCDSKDFRDYLLTAYAKWLSLTLSPICGNVNKIDTQRESLEDYLDEINCKNC